MKIMAVRESPSEFHGFSALPKDGTDDFLEYAMHLAFYAAITAIFMMIIGLIAKLMWNCNGEEGSREEARATENSGLLSPKHSVFRSYGTNGEDLESGSSLSSEDLYDGKICVICYDNQRNCFFVPCGHCVACYRCTERIIKEESKSCPICRGIIDKIRKLHIL